MNRVNDGTDCMELSFKLYHVWELRSPCQQSTAEAPFYFRKSLAFGTLRRIAWEGNLDATIAPKGAFFVGPLRLIAM